MDILSVLGNSEGSYGWDDDKYYYDIVEHVVILILSFWRLCLNLWVDLAVII